MSHKILITLSDVQVKALDELMAEDLAEQRSAYIGQMIGKEKKMRDADKSKRGPGRPRKEEADEEEKDEFDLQMEKMEPAYWVDDIPKTIIYFNRKIGPKEWEFLKNRRVVI